MKSEQNHLSKKDAKSFEGNPVLLYISKFRELGLLAFILCISFIIQLRNPAFLTIDNLSDMITNTAILSILAVGMMLVIVTRGIDLSVGSTIGLSGMIVAQIVSANSDLPPVVAILIGIGIGAICGLLIGSLVSKLKILPIIATLAAMFIFRGITFMVSDGSWVSAHQMPEQFLELGRGTFLGIHYLVWIAGAIYLFFYYFVNHLRLGRQIYAVGSNPESAKVSGISEAKINFLVYSMMGALAGLSGVLWVAKFASAQGDTATGFEMNVIAACILGGVSISGGSGKVSGVLMGSLLIGILNNALPLIGVSAFWQMGIQGFIILTAVIANTYVKRSVDKGRLLRRQI